METIKPKKLSWDNKTFEDINNNLVCELAEKYPKMFKQVMEQDDCDIDGFFLGFVDIYYFLSKIIPRDWIIVDFGCAYAPQAYYFRKHKKYIGVNPTEIKKFSFKNTEYFIGTIKDYLNTKPEQNKRFAICSYVTSNQTDLVRKYYQDLFVYYIK